MNRKVVKLVGRLTPQKLKNIYHKINKSRKINIYNLKGKKVVIKHPRRVSVIIPNYNYEKFIIERIDSVLRQTYPIYELIILDDCSTDNSVEIINKKVKQIDSVKVRFVPNKENSKCVFSQWQKGFELAKGDYIWIAEADDLCNPRFLEEAIKPFEDKDVVLSYTESMRIDENNNIISPDCRDYMLVINNYHWNKSYIHDGTDEVRECLSICNTIPNVSAVIWKKGNYNEFLECAKEYRLSGDWYIYFNVLKSGKIAYNNKSLNYFRKHSTSTSAITKRETELRELLSIQKQIRDYFELDTQTIIKQTHRYEWMLPLMTKKVVTELNPLLVKNIAWIIPYPIKGSGGIRTIVQNINTLVKHGYACDIYVEEDYFSTGDYVKKLITKYYGECLADVYIGIQFKKTYDLMFATYSVLTADYTYYSDAKKKAYFIQDYEPWFVPMGDMFLSMEHSYKYGFKGISIGKWLTHKISTEHNSPMHYFDFCADLNVYKPLKNIKKEKALCFIFQPEKPRRCSLIGLKALKIIKELRPDVKIYLYGSDIEEILDFEAENLKIIPITECNKLYNKCLAGLCISSSNPSRIPFEMMAAGLPVVDLYRDNNLYDVPDTGVLLADSTPEAIATALLKIVDDRELQESMSKSGFEYMQNFPIEKGYNQFLKFVDDVLNEKDREPVVVKKLYNKKPVMPSKEIIANMDVIKTIPVPKKNTGSQIRRMVRAKRRIRNIKNSALRRLFKIW